jgi:hypothetical protein
MSCVNLPPAALEATANWQLLCAQQPEQFLPIAGSARIRRRVTAWEVEQIACLLSGRRSLPERAAALRSIVELRGCSVRQAALFFDATDEVVLAALSLVRIAAPASSRSLPATRALVKAA